MKISDAETEEMLAAAGIQRHPACKITREYDCGYRSALNCHTCKYGFGTKDPEAKCNQL